MNILGKIVMFIPSKIYGYAKSLNTFLMSPEMIKEGTAQTFDKITKVIGVTTGGVGAGKGLADAHEAFLCADGLCFVVSCVGVAADGLNIVASWVPGPNLTCLVTIPVSVTCKTFVYCCKRGFFPRGNC